MKKICISRAKKKGRRESKKLIAYNWCNIYNRYITRRKDKEQSIVYTLNFY